MECLQIDWKNIDGTFEKDDFYENIQAPKWIDFTVPIQPVDDHAWFCGKAGCTHEIKTVLQALNQGNANPFETCVKSSMDASTAKTLSAGVAAIKKTRPVVSSSLSSLSELKAAYAKNKVLHHMQMPPISESKAQATKNNRRQQASENENPNRACKLQDGACKKSMVRALEGTARHTKVSEMKRIIGREETAHVSNADASFHSAKTLVSLSQTGPLMEASKSVFIFGNRDPMHAKSTLNKAVDKEPLPNSDNITEAKIKKVGGGGTRFFSRPSPTARNPYLSASLATPIVRRSAANVRPLHGVCLGNDKVVECKPPRVTRDVRVTVQANACRKKTDYHKKDANTGKIPPQFERSDRPEIGSKDNVVIPHSASLEKQDTQRESKEEESILDTDSSAAPIAQDKQLLHPSQGAVEERKSADIQARDKEDSITNTLEKFLENLHITSHDDELVSNEEDSELRETVPCTDCAENAKKQEMVNPDIKESVREQEASMQTHQDADDNILKDEAVSNHAAEQSASEHGRKEDAMERVGRCSLDSAQLSLISEPLSWKDESNPSSAALHVSSDDGGSAKDEALSLDNDKGSKKIQQKQFTTDWQKCRGTKRKSSELNLNCSSKNDKHGTQKKLFAICQQLKQSSSTAKLPIISSSQRPGLQQDSSEEHHKKLKTATQAFKPFRFRTEERGALKELGLGKKESGSPKSKNTVHHALRMPSFGRPFRPQRSTKKLTIPREPKFHVSRTKNPCTTNLATDLPL